VDGGRAAHLTWRPTVGAALSDAVSRGTNVTLTSGKRTWAARRNVAFSAGGECLFLARRSLPVDLLVPQQPTNPEGDRHCQTPASVRPKASTRSRFMK
jgi:hypothetical protein